MDIRNEIRRLEKEIEDTSAYEKSVRELHKWSDPETQHHQKNADDAEEELKELKKRLINLKHNYEKEPYQKRGYFNNYRTNVRSWNPDRECNFKYVIVEKNKDGTIYHQAPISYSTYDKYIKEYKRISTTNIKAENGTPLTLTIHQSNENGRNFIYEYNSKIYDKICPPGGYDTKPSAPNPSYDTNPTSVTSNSSKYVRSWNDKQSNLEEEKQIKELKKKMNQLGINPDGKNKSAIMPYNTRNIGLPKNPSPYYTPNPAPSYSSYSYPSYPVGTPYTVGTPYSSSSLTSNPAPSSPYNKYMSSQPPLVRPLIPGLIRKGGKYKSRKHKSRKYKSRKHKNTKRRKIKY